MMSSRLRAVALRCVLGVVGLLISPFGCLKELSGLAAVLGAFLWFLSAAATLPSKDATRSAAERMQLSTISRLLPIPADGIMCLYRDHRAVLAIDDVHGEESYYQAIPAAHHLEFHNNGRRWGYLTNRIETGFAWWTSNQGTLEIPLPERRIMPKSTAVAAHGDIAAVLDLSDRVHIWQPNADGVVQIVASYVIPNCEWVYLSPSGDVLAARCAARDIRFLDAVTGAELSPPLDYAAMITCTAWSTDGGLFAIGHESGTVRVFPTRQRDELEITVRLTDAAVSAIALNSDGDRLAVGTSMGEITMFHRGEVAWSQQAHRGNIRSMVIVDDRDQLVSGATDGMISARSATTGTLVRELKP